ncbi:MAG TPA: pilin [bacterium]|nr:pilin [bacterium]
MFKKTIITLALFLIPCFVMAASVKLDNPVNGVESLFNVSTYVGQVIGNVLKIIGSVSLLLLIYGGFLMIMSGGNESKIKEGRSIITYTAIGLVVIFSAYIILTFFLGALGGTIYNEYYDMPNPSGQAGSITEPVNCPVMCVANAACSGQDFSCLLVKGCCDLSLDPQQTSADMEIDVTDPCSGCNVITNCAFQTPWCAAKNCCIP